MGREKLSLFKRILLINKYINKKEITEIRGIDCEFCKSQDLKKISECKMTNIDNSNTWSYVYECKDCGARIEEFQTHYKSGDKL